MTKISKTFDKKPDLNNNLFNSKLSCDALLTKDIRSVECKNEAVYFYKYIKVSHRIDNQAAACFKRCEECFKYIENENIAMLSEKEFLTIKKCQILK